MIELINVSKYYNNNGVVALGLRNVNLKLSKGEIVAITGESGSGKSTLLNVICGVDTYEDGEILFKGNETSYFNQDDMDNYRKQNISFIYQNYNIIDSYTVLQNVMLPLIINGVDYKDAKLKALQLIDRVGLSHRIKHKGIRLSGGEKQRCVIARALASDCPILACDEPTGNLDSKTGEEIIKLIKEVSADKLVLIVTHNYEQVSDIVTRTIRVSDGEIVEDINKEEKCCDNQKEEVDFSNQRVKTNKLMWISLKNLLATPRKNLLCLAVFFVLSFIGFFLFLTSVAASEESKYNPYAGFNNTVNNRLIVYNSDYKPIDMDRLNKINGTIYENAFFEDVLNNLYLDDDCISYISGTITTYLPNNIELKGGNKQIEENDVFVILPKNNQGSLSDLNKRLNQEVNLNYNGTHIIESINLNLCGFGILDGLTAPLYVINDIHYNKLNVINLRDVSVLINGHYINTLPYDSNENKIVYCSPSKPDKLEAKAFLQGIYELDLSSYTVEWQQSTTENVVVSINCDNYNPVYEATIYADDINSAINIINSLGMSYYQPAKSGYNKMSFNYILFVLYTVLSCLAMLILTFVAYVILARMYGTKNKDYTILRSLGVVKKQLARIVDFEVLFMGVIGAILAIIVFYICSIFEGSFGGLLKYNSFGFMILYFVLMLMFAYYISRRFNSKLFKFSINTSIKDEVE